MHPTTTLASLLVLLAPQPAEAKVNVSTLPTCHRIYTQAEHAAYTRSVYNRDNVTRKAQARVERMRRCQKGGRARVNAKRLTRRVRGRYEMRRSLLPYDCGSHGRFAIPCYIVECESRYSWTARNPSGAWGAYQLLGWLPYGSSRVAQHRMAAKLWAGGKGRGHWVCA